MKILTSEEAVQYEGRVAPSRHMSDSMKQLIQLAAQMVVGQSAIIEKDEWSPKSPPSVSGHFKNKAFSIRVISENAGWLIKRVR